MAVGSIDRTRAPGVMSADALAGDPVINRQDTMLGTIDDILIDVGCGTVAYALLAPEGLAGVDDRVFAIPWSALALDAERRCFILDADRQRLEKAPGVDQEPWSATGDLSWAHDVHQYYGVRPYWQEAPGT